MNWRRILHELRGPLLILGIWLTAIAARPGDAWLATIGGGLCIGLFVVSLDERAQP